MNEQQLNKMKAEGKIEDFYLGNSGKIYYCLYAYWVGTGYQRVWREVEATNGN